MRQTKVFTSSLPSQMVKEVDLWAKKESMTRSELVRAALRLYFEELDFAEAVRVAKKERRDGKLKELKPGGLRELIESG